MRGDEPRGTKALLFLGTSGFSDMIVDFYCQVEEWDIRCKRWVGRRVGCTRLQVWRWRVDEGKEVVAGLKLIRGG